MARNDGIDRTVARNQDLPTPDDVAKIQEHNEREKNSYSNQDIVPERTSMNVHFKAPTDDYVKMFEQMEIEMMMEAIALVMDEHGIMCADGHWMTNDELIELSDEEVVDLFNRCYGKG